MARENARRNRRGSSEVAMRWTTQRGRQGFLVGATQGQGSLLLPHNLHYDQPKDKDKEEEDGTQGTTRALRSLVVEVVEHPLQGHSLGSTRAVSRRDSQAASALPRPLSLVN